MSLPFPVTVTGHRKGVTCRIVKLVARKNRPGKEAVLQEGEGVNDTPGRCASGNTKARIYGRNIGRKGKKHKRTHQEPVDP